MTDKTILKCEAGELKGKANNKQALLELIEDWQWDYPVAVRIQSASAILDYLAVFWIWMKSFAEQMTERGRPVTENELHELFCYKFLGMLPPKTYKNGEELPARLRTITYPERLKRPEFYHFMRSIEDLATDWGLQIPENESQYFEDKAKENS